MKKKKPVAGKCSCGGNLFINSEGDKGCHSCNFQDTQMNLGGSLRLHEKRRNHEKQ